MTDTEKLVVATLAAARFAKQSGTSTTRIVEIYGEVAEEMRRAGHLSLGRTGDQGQGRR